MASDKTAVQISLTPAQTSLLDSLAEGESKTRSEFVHQLVIDRLVKGSPFGAIGVLDEQGS